MVGNKARGLENVSNHENTERIIKYFIIFQALIVTLSVEQ